MDKSTEKNKAKIYSISIGILIVLMRTENLKLAWLIIESTPVLEIASISESNMQVKYLL